MENNKMNKKELLDLKKRIDELETLVDELVKERNSKELTMLPWIGNLGQWQWLIESNEVFFNDKKVTNLGYTKDEIPKDIGFEFFTNKLHKDDYEYVMQNMRDHLMGKRDAYEVEYRIKAKDGNYKWYYDRGKITKYDENHKPLMLSGIVFDISKNKKIEDDLKIANAQLKEILIHDDLTNTYNRRYFNERLTTINKTKTSTLVLLDLDYFKNINDEFGHDVGDKVLVEVCLKINKVLGNQGQLFRWGGEEFFILLENIKLKQAIEITEKIRMSIQKCPFNKCEKVTASFGIVQITEKDDINSLVRKTDDLMYKAKKAGRNCIKF
ncbi:MAG: sensor domain-containing diguanylate cyclase [Pleomorphochaeta sp.]